MSGERTKGDWKTNVSSSCVDIFTEDFTSNIATVNEHGEGDSGMERCKADAAYICKADNNHERLIEALEILIESSVYTHFENRKCFHCEAFNQAREVLARVKKEG